MEQIVDTPSSGGGLGQESSSSAGPADEDFTLVFFALFPVGKSAQLGPHSSPMVPASVSSSTLAAQPVSDSWWASLTPAQQAELEEARAAVSREHASKKKGKKRRNRRTRRSLS